MKKTSYTNSASTPHLAIFTAAIIFVCTLCRAPADDSRSQAYSTDRAFTVPLGVFRADQTGIAVDVKLQWVNNWLLMLAPWPLTNSIYGPADWTGVCIPLAITNALFSLSLTDMESTNDTFWSDVISTWSWGRFASLRVGWDDYIDGVGIPEVGRWYQLRFSVLRACDVTNDLVLHFHCYKQTVIVARTEFNVSPSTVSNQCWRGAGRVRN